MPVLLLLLAYLAVECGSSQRWERSLEDAGQQCLDWLRASPNPLDDLRI